MNSAGYTPEEPIAAIATALAPAALGIVRCSGKGVIELLAPLFSRPRPCCRRRETPLSMAGSQNQLPDRRLWDGG